MWRYCAAAVPGVKHRRADDPCQDAVVCTLTEGGAFIAALADGAGSATAAEVAARIATTAVVESLKAAIENRPALAAVVGGEAIPMDRARHQLLDGSTLRTFVRDAVEIARAEIMDAADASGLSPRDYATTLLVVVIDGERGVAAQIGDGVIVQRNEVAGWRWVFWPQHGEYANSTHFLVENDAFVHLQLTELDPEATDLALMSDGLEALALDLAARTAHAPFFDGMMRPLLAEPDHGERLALAGRLADLLASSRFADRADDDLSLVLATRRPVGTVIPPTESPSNTSRSTGSMRPASGQGNAGLAESGGPWTPRGGTAARGDQSRLGGDGGFVWRRSRKRLRAGVKRRRRGPAPNPDRHRRLRRHRR